MNNINRMSQFNQLKYRVWAAFPLASKPLSRPVTLVSPMMEYEYFYANRRLYRMVSRPTMSIFSGGNRNRTPPPRWMNDELLHDLGFENDFCPLSVTYL